MTINDAPAAPHHQHAGGENLEVMREAYNYNEYLRNLIRKYSGEARTALDFGAGIGTFSNSLSIPPQNVYCIEPDPASRTYLAQCGHVPQQSLAEIGDAAIDYVFSLNVLEHIEDDAETVREIVRVLKPGGRVLLYVPAFMLLFSSMDTHVGHHRRYRMSGLSRLIVDAGLNIEKKAYTDALGFFATLAYKLVDSDQPKPLSARAVGWYDRYLFPLSRLMSVPFSRLLGKNVYVVASKPAAQPHS